LVGNDVLQKLCVCLPEPALVLNKLEKPFCEEVVSIVANLTGENIHAWT